MNIKKLSLEETMDVEGELIDILRESIIIWAEEHGLDLEDTTTKAEVGQLLLQGAANFLFGAIDPENCHKYLDSALHIVKELHDDGLLGNVGETGKSIDKGSN